MAVRVRIAAYPPEFFDSFNLGVRRIQLAALVRKTSSLLRGSGFKSRGTHQRNVRVAQLADAYGRELYSL